MANPAAEIRAIVQAAHPEAVGDGRGRSWLRHRIADAPDGRQRFVVDSSIGPVHYGDNADQEIDTAWVADTGAWQWKMEADDYQAHARNVFNAGNILEYRDRVTGEWVIFDPQSINWINQDNSRQQIAIKQAINAQVTGDVMNFPGGYGAGRHFRYELQPGRLQKLITIDSAANLPTPTVTGTIWFEAEFSLSHSAGVGVWLDGVKWEKVNGVRVRSANRVEFRDEATGQTVLWVLDFPRAFDSDATTAIGEIEVRRSGGPAALFITVRIPKEFFDTAVYPVMIDPTVEVQIAAGANDAHEAADGSGFNATALFIEMSSSATAAARFNGGMLWPITGPGSGDTVDVAYVSVWALSASSDDPNVDFYCEDVDSAANFTTTADVTSRTVTTASVNWTATGLGPGPDNSPSLVGPVQEVFDRPGWASGNNLCLVGKGRSDSAFGFQVKSYENNPANAPRIHIEYTEGAAPTGDSIPYLTVLRRRRFRPLLVR